MRLNGVQRQAYKELRLKTFPFAGPKCFVTFSYYSGKYFQILDITYQAQKHHNTPTHNFPVFQLPVAQQTQSYTIG